MSVTVDYKILAFVLSNWLQKVMVGSQQTAYIQTNKILGLMLCLDCQKALDSLNWNSMVGVLDKFNFGQTLKNG